MFRPVLLRISIHAPTRGATLLQTFQGLVDRISIHAPTRGATLCCGVDDCFTIDFNPRSHEGSDISFINIRRDLYTISIHAPTRGATLSSTSQTANVLISIHAPTRGATIINVTDPSIFLISIHAPTRGATVTGIFEHFPHGFQSTLPRGERRAPRLIRCIQINFNPRSHEGSDW